MRRIGLRLFPAEKAVQHVFVTGAFAFDAASFRDDAPFDYRWFLASGAIVAVLLAVALRGHRRSLQLAIALPLFNIVGEFAYQGGLNILIPISSSSPSSSSSSSPSANSDAHHAERELRLQRTPSGTRDHNCKTRSAVS